MSAINNKDILNSLVSLFDMLDSKIKQTNESMLKLEQTIRQTNNTGSGADAKKIIENTEKLNAETAKLTELEKAQLKIKQQIEAANNKLIIAQSEEAKQLAEINLKIAAQNKLTKENTEFVKKQADAYKELTKKTNEAQSNFKRLAAEFGVNSEQAKRAKIEFDKLDNELRKINEAAKDGRRDVGRYRMVLEGTGNAIKTFIAGLGIQQLFQFGKEIINTRAEFQKYQIVLENSLGSSKKATEALGMIEEFAAKTPFSVSELTSSFIKLTNQGFKPSESEMRKLGDLASSTGKSFDQLTEALIDAQAFEFERLKEFGIRAKKEGDNITFTFKDQETVVKANNAEIRKYILSLGDLPGVLGSNEKIAKGLTGQISNLGDSFDRLKNTLGKVIEQPASEALSDISNELSFLSTAITRATGPTETFSEKLIGWIDTLSRANPILAGINAKLKDWFGIEDRIKRQKEERNRQDKESISNLLDDKTIENAKEVGRLRAQNEIALKKLNDAKQKNNDIKKESITLTDSEIKKINEQKLAEQQYNYELQRRLELKMNEIETPEISTLEVQEVSSINNIVKANEDMQAMLKSQRDAAEKDKQEKFEADLKRQQQLQDALIESAEYAGAVIGDLFAKGQLSFKEFSKVILLTTLNYIEKELILLKVQTFAKELMKRGPAGIASGAILVGLITAAFSAAKAKIQSFATGTEYVNGEGTETSDSIPARLSKGERVVPSKINKQLMGIPNNRLPEIVANGLNTQRMESILEEMRYYNQMSSLYLSNGANTYVHNGFLVINDWKTGKVIKMPIKD